MDAGRHAESNHVVGNVAHDHGAGPNNSACTDTNAVNDNCADS